MQIILNSYHIHVLENAIKLKMHLNIIKFKSGSVYFVFLRVFYSLVIEKNAFVCITLNFTQIMKENKIHRYNIHTQTINGQDFSKIILLWKIKSSKFKRKNEYTQIDLILVIENCEQYFLGNKIWSFV